jgi:hypothetical protein
MADIIPPAVSPPKDVAFGDTDDDVAIGSANCRFIAVDDLRNNPSTANLLVS